MSLLRQISKENIEALRKELDGYTDYLPIQLIPLVDGYMANATDEAHNKIFEVRNQQPGGKKNEEYFKQEVIDWLNEHKEYKKYFEEIL